MDYHMKGWIDGWKVGWIDGWKVGWIGWWTMGNMWKRPNTSSKYRFYNKHRSSTDR